MHASGLPHPVNRLLPVGMRCLPIHDRYEAPASALTRALLVSDELSLDRARTLVSATRNLLAPDVNALIVAASAFDELLVADWLVAPDLYEFDEILALYQSTTANAVFTAPGRQLDAISPLLNAALDRVGQLAGRDPLSVLHHLHPDTLVDIDRGEDSGLADLHGPSLAHAREHATGFGDEPFGTYDVAALLGQIEDEPRVHVVWSDASPAVMLMRLGFGGFNRCPEPHEHARVWEYWGRELGAVPVYLARDRIHGLIERPVRTRAGLIRLVDEMLAYCVDLARDGLLPLAGSIYRGTRLSFCWE